MRIHHRRMRLRHITRQYLTGKNGREWATELPGRSALSDRKDRAHLSPTKVPNVGSSCQAHQQSLGGHRKGLRASLTGQEFLSRIISFYSLKNCRSFMVTKPGIGALPLAFLVGLLAWGSMPIGTSSSRREACRGTEVLRC
jgi:hypothetical protein